MFRWTTRKGALPLALSALLAFAAAFAEGGASAGSHALELRPLAEARLAPAAFVIDAFQHDTRFVKQTTPGQADADLEETLLGTRSLRVSTDGDAKQVNMRATGLGPLDLSDVFLRLHLRVEGVENLDAMYFYLSNDGFETFDSYLIVAGNDQPEERYMENGEWVTITTALGTPMWREPRVDLRRVTDMQISTVDNGRGPVTVWLGGLEAVQRPGAAW